MCREQKNEKSRLNSVATVGLWALRAAVSRKNKPGAIAWQDARAMQRDWLCLLQMHLKTVLQLCLVITIYGLSWLVGGVREEEVAPLICYNPKVIQPSVI